MYRPDTVLSSLCTWATGHIHYSYADIFKSVSKLIPHENNTIIVSYLITYIKQLILQIFLLKSFSLTITT